MPRTRLGLKDFRLLLLADDLPPDAAQRGRQTLYEGTEQLGD
jgi:hypothetical protein